MGAYIDHAAYYTGDLDWYLNFFETVFDMKLQRLRQNDGGLREVWLSGGLQLCETEEPQREDGRAAHLCLITEDLEAAREKALALGCSPMPKHHWVKFPDGLALELFEAPAGTVEAIAAIPKRKA